MVVFCLDSGRTPGGSQVVKYLRFLRAASVSDPVVFVTAVPTKYLLKPLGGKVTKLFVSILMSVN